jgi:hypothetical protein
VDLDGPILVPKHWPGKDVQVLDKGPSISLRTFGQLWSQKPSAQKSAKRPLAFAEQNNRRLVAFVTVIPKLYN